MIFENVFEGGARGSRQTQCESGALEFSADIGNLFEILENTGKLDQGSLRAIHGSYPREWTLQRGAVCFLLEGGRVHPYSVRVDKIVHTFLSTLGSRYGALEC